MDRIEAQSHLDQPKNKRAAWACLFCDSPATSYEHVFASALGGRRMDPRIYCKKHNQALGPYIKAILEALQFFNAQLNMISDKRDEPLPVRMTSEGDGSEVLATASSIHPDVDISDLVANLSEGKHDLPLATADQRELFKRLAKKAGWKVNVVGSTQTEFFIHCRLVAHPIFDSDDFFLAVIYMSLTFFAHYFRQQSRHQNFSGVKRLLRGGPAYAGRDLLSDVDLSDILTFVWPTPLQPAWPDQNPFEFGHTVAVCQLDGVVYGYVSFFGAVNYAVRLAEGIPGVDDAVLTFINPLESEQPKEWESHRGAEYCFNPEHERITADGVQKLIEGRLSDLVGRIVERQAKQRDEAFVSKVNAARSEGQAAVMSAITSQLHRNRQVIFNSLLRLREYPAQLPLPGLDTYIIACGTHDPSSGDGLSQEGALVMTATLKALAEHVALRVAFGALDVAFVTDILTGITGQAILLTEVIRSFPSWLGRSASS